MQDEGIELVSSFLVVAEELNFRRAAERLNLDQSALTRRIQKLEHAINVQLFERTTREVTLTQAGQSFYQGNAYLMGRYRESIAVARQIARGMQGELRIAYMAFAAVELMPSALGRFKDQHPDIDVSLHYLHSQGQKLALANNEIDVGYLIGPFTHPDFRTLSLRREKLYAVAALGHPLLEKEVLSPADIAGHRIVLGDERDWGEFRWRLFDLFNAEGVELTLGFEASITLALNGLVSAGLGITIYPESLIGSIGPKAQARMIEHPAFECDITLAYRRANKSAQLASFLSLATQELSAK